MKTYLLLLFALIGFYNMSYSQQDPKSAKWNWLIGEWKDKGSQNSVNAENTFTFNYDLDKKIIVRKTKFPQPDITRKYNYTHEDLMIIYSDQAGRTDKSIYFDNEGHIINYKISFEGKSIVFKNYDKGNSPSYRLTYTRMDDETINRKFELSRDGENFITFEEGISIKVK